MHPPSHHHGPIKGRGAQNQPPNRYLAVQCEPDFGQLDDEDRQLEMDARPATVYLADESQSIVATNNSADIPFRYSINPYRGCAHGCSYCYARPTHEYLGFSAGLDFETKVLVKHRAAELFRRWLARPEWNAEHISISGVTDCYQPAERQFQLTRQCLEVAAQCRQPVAIVTKNALVARDLDLLAQLARFQAVQVAVSITTLDAELARRMEPRTSLPDARLRVLGQLSAAGIPTQVMVAPVIPGLNDSEVPGILAAAHQAGAQSASYVLLRLPTTVVDVFFGWLDQYYPHRADKIRQRVESTRDGQLNESRFGDRMRGHGEIAGQIRQAFGVFAARYGLDRPLPALCSDHFRPPRIAGQQQRLF